MCISIEVISALSPLSDLNLDIWELINEAGCAPRSFESGPSSRPICENKGEIRPVKTFKERAHLFEGEPRDFSRLRAGMECTLERTKHHRTGSIPPFLETPSHQGVLADIAKETVGIRVALGSQLTDDLLSATPSTDRFSDPNYPFMLTGQKRTLMLSSDD